MEFLVSDLKMEPMENSSVSKEESRLLALQNALDIYVPPILIVFGSGGNMVSLAVMLSSHFSHDSCSVLLCFLVVMDTGVLLSGLLRFWIISVFDVDIRTISNTWCRTHYFLTYLLQHLSSWTLVLITIERCVSVLRPLRARVLCTRRRLLVCIAIMVASLVIVNAHEVFTLGLHSDGNGNGSSDLICKFDGRYYYGIYVWPYVDYVILALLPLVLLAIGNVFIVVKVARRTQPVEQGTSRYQPSRRRHKTVTSLTRMLFVVTIVFFLTTTPIEIYMIGFQFWEKDTPLGKARTLTAYVICSLWHYVNNSVNFLLYCVSGSRFRRALQYLFRQQPSPGARQTGSVFEDRVVLSHWDRIRRSSRLTSW